MWKASLFSPIKVLNSWVNQLIISYLYMRVLIKPSSLERYKISISCFYTHSVLECNGMNKNLVPCDQSMKGETSKVSKLFQSFDRIRFTLMFVSFRFILVTSVFRILVSLVAWFSLRCVFFVYLCKERQDRQKLVKQE